MNFVNENKETKLQLPLPLFAGTATSTFKRDSCDNYTQGKTLLFAAKSSCLDDLSDDSEEETLNDSCEKEHLVKDNFTVSERLTEIYKESVMNKTARNGCFLKCNYIEELVLQEDLNYFIMKIYPTKILLYHKNPYGVHFFYAVGFDAEYKILLDSIDDEELPTFIYEEIIKCGNFLYNYHCFLQIQKYLFEYDCAEPVFSSFILLKPKPMLLLPFIENSVSDTNNNNGSSLEPKEDEEDCESKLYFLLSGPICLDVDAHLVDLIPVLNFYSNPFGSPKLKSILSKRPKSVNKQSFEVNPSKEELLKNLDKKIPHSSHSSEEKDFQLDGIPFSYIDLKEDLHSSLVKRNLKISDTLYTSHTTTLVEVFTLRTREKALTSSKKCEEDYEKYLSVFWKYGQFYACLTLDQYTFDPCDPNDFIPLIGDRENLDRYILKVAQILSCRFTEFLNIQYKNMIDNTEKHFFPPLSFKFPHIVSTLRKNKADDHNNENDNTDKDSPLLGTETDSEFHGERDIWKRHDLLARGMWRERKTGSEPDDEQDFLKMHDFLAEEDDYIIKCAEIQKMQTTVTSDMETSCSDNEEESNSDQVIL